MKATFEIESDFNCSLEMAYRTPIHGDATRILRGFGPIPPCIRFDDDETWGKENGSRIPIMKGNWLLKGGGMGLDKVLVRQDNQYWKWQVTDFGTWTLFFTNKAVGEWWVEEAPREYLEREKISSQVVKVKWKYTYHASSALTQPFNWLFVKLFWRVVMKRGMNYIQEMAEKGSPFLYE